MGHLITQPVRSNPWIRSVFSVLLRDVCNSNCGPGAYLEGWEDGLAPAP